jgi:hypothetical protein
MRASSLDPATKAKIAVMLNAKRATAHVQNPVAATAPPPPVSSQAPASNGVPACTDVVGIARVVMQANPGLPPNALAAAVDQFQISMGCRAPPPPAISPPLWQTRPTITCNTIGFTTTCTPSDSTEPTMTCNTIGGTTTCY